MEERGHGGAGERPKIDAKLDATEQEGTTLRPSEAERGKQLYYKNAVPRVTAQIVKGEERKEKGQSFRVDVGGLVVMKQQAATPERIREELTLQR